MNIYQKCAWVLLISVITFLVCMTVDEYNSLHWGIRTVTVIVRICGVLSIGIISMTMCVILVLLNKNNDDKRKSSTT